MKYTGEEMRLMTFGEWLDLFEEYKKIHNICVTQSTFREPRKKISLMDGMYGWDEVAN